LYTIAIEERDQKLRTTACCTILLDGWSDASHNSIYALMALYGNDSSEIIVVMNLSKERHTAANLLRRLSDALNQSAINIQSI
jgi:hypothetical protein